MEEIIKGEWFTANRLGNEQFDRIQTANEDAKIKREMFGDVVSIGVEYGRDSFEVVEPLAGLNVIVKKGMAFAYGYPGYTSGDVTLSISPNTDPSLTRIDVIVMRANFTTSGRVSKLVVIEGTPGSGAPPIIKDLITSLWDTKLAEVTILPSQSTIDEDDIEDFRKLKEIDSGEKVELWSGDLAVGGTASISENYANFDKLVCRFTGITTSAVLTMLDGVTRYFGDSVSIGDTSLTTMGVEINFISELTFTLDNARRLQHNTLGVHGTFTIDRLESIIGIRK